ncbi:hypothetical protein HOE425_310134 [Hoeflea sp. EC-HK425]|nr:hypothetical protein HOE425_310134 [Hoeflea sp. EC-HK425]
MPRSTRRSAPARASPASGRTGWSMNPTARKTCWSSRMSSKPAAPCSRARSAYSTSAKSASSRPAACATTRSRWRISPPSSTFPASASARSRSGLSRRSRTPSRRLPPPAKRRWSPSRTEARCMAKHSRPRTRRRFRGFLCVLQSRRPFHCPLTNKICDLSALRRRFCILSHEGRGEGHALSAILPLPFVGEEVISAS